MTTTRQIARDQWRTTFDRFTREHLRGEVQQTVVTIEVVSPDIGDQIEVSRARLRGLTYDPKGNQLEVLVDDLDHPVFDPSEIWVIEESDGFISAVEVVRADGTKDILEVIRSRPPAVGQVEPSLLR